ncbi:universal stress protein [Pelodictyon phaeoclathratiforme]|jgi:nucleotide-binding universal stress UspA family protein|uniref:UspA domain protein n=1 Tax=Pelodictyon phaeoclathratiforme (strain DSM 5477 / BU-1) TaxID=324925 RepID=B4SAC8_PELPB|nr:universal stress protein [Pelodictyon phaeoclathratiforme]ACF43814.1 UspA domain protein [Pelodictyon phaeoclathratiforme BU-1]MBV5289880.1 universal stress protein [Pelodictyon phaeoclathratiforme]
MIHLARILCPTDYSATSDNAVRYAVEFARKVGAHVRFLHILSSATPPEKIVVAPELLAASPDEDDALPENFSRILMAEKKKGLNADLRVLKGEAPKVIVEQANSWGADLIIMGSHGRTGLHRLMMGSVAEEVFRSSDIPVLLVKELAAAKIIAE